MNDHIVSNPYACSVDDPMLAPFAGRQAVFARLRLQFTDPARQGALLVLGRRRIGKTAFLRAFDVAFDETFVGVYVSLRDLTLQSENEWWLSLAQAITERLIERAFTLHRLIDLAPPGDDARAWFAEAYLPPVLTLIRPHRHLVLLADDADFLLEAIKSGRLAPDTLSFLRELLDTHARLYAALTLDAAQESHTGDLQPLVRPIDVIRLTNLAQDEVEWLLREPVQGLYRLNDGALDAAWRLTGGQPAHIQALGCVLYRRYDDDLMAAQVTEDDVKQAGAQVFTMMAEELNREWNALSYHEQQAMRAISQLQYAHPLRPVDAVAISHWLADSDDPIDVTAVSATIRSLEYHELVALTPVGVDLTSDLMRRWLLERAYASPLAVARRVPAAPDGSPALSRRNRGLRIALLIVILVMFIVGLLLLTTLSNLPRDEYLIPPEPTVTLVGE
ncbi:MAG: ATP-binding protein [Anaerolineae bacterium]|nr:ATP-binding protein [Anaerolineae bacterium]